jgi:hypothetical protein
MEKTSINTTVKDFNDVQRALEAVKTELDLVKEKLNPASEDEEDMSAAPGSIRIIKNTEEENLFEISTEDGWKKPVMGESPITLKNLVSNTRAPEKKSIDEIETEDSNKDKDTAKKTLYDEKAGKFILPRADYDSGWLQDASNDAAITIEHNLDTTVFSLVDLQVSNASTGANATWVRGLVDSQAGGYVVQVKDSNNIFVGTEDSGPPRFDCAGLTWQDEYSTHFRLRLWK